jgi:replication factor C small subunit
MDMSMMSGEVPQSNTELTERREALLPWTEKYRPQKLSDIVLPLEVRTIIENVIKSGEPMNFLFHSGKPGTGKTSTALAIPMEMGCEYEVFRVSQNTMSKIEEIESFAAYRSLDGKPRFAILDECDAPSSTVATQFYTLLQTLIESTASTLRFILTCNNLYKLPAPIISRCTPVSFAHNSLKDAELKQMKNACWARMMKIAKEVSKGPVDKSTVTTIVQRYFPDMRAMVDMLHLNWLAHDFTIAGDTSFVDANLEEHIWELLQKGDDTELRKYASANVKDHSAFYLPFCEHLMRVMPRAKRLDLGILTGEYQYRSVASAVDQEINLNAYLCQIMRLNEAK